MSGLFCVIDLKNESSPRRLKRDFANSFRNKNNHVDAIENDSILLGGVQLMSTFKKKELPISASYNSLIGVFSGKIDNINELSTKFNVEKINSESVTSFLLRLYAENEFEYVKYLKGLFLLAIYNKDTQVLDVSNDRYGFYPIFYTRSSERFLLSSKMKTILSDGLIEPQLDNEAIPEFFTLGHLLGDKTFFKNVKLIPPATHLRFNAKQNSLSVGQYWDFGVKSSNSSDNNASIDYYFRNFRKLMKAAVDRAVMEKDRIGVFLSGGIDSRILAAFAAETNKEITTFTFGLRNCLQHQIAQSVAARLDVRNLFFEIKPESLSKYSEEIICKGEGLVRIRDCSFIPFLKEIANITDVVLLGTFGGQLFGQDLNDARDILLANDEDKMVNCVLKRYSSAIALSQYQYAFTKSYSNLFKRTFLKNLKSSLRRARLHFSDPLDIFQYWEHYNREHRYIFHGCRSYLNWYLETRHPFLDYDLIDFFAFQLPQSLRLNQKFYEKALNYCFPFLANIKLERTNAPPDSSTLTSLYGKGTRFLKRRLIKIMKRIDKKNTLVSPIDYRDGYADWLRNSGKDYVGGILLDPRALERGFFREEWIRRVLTEHERGIRNYGSILMFDLVSFELLMRNFLNIHTSVD